MDGELGHSERVTVLRDVRSNARLSELWSRYHLIGSMFRSELPFYSARLPQRVGDLIDKEHPHHSNTLERLSSLRNRYSPNLTRNLAVAASIMLAVAGGWYTVQLTDDPAINFDTSRTITETGVATKWETIEPGQEDQLNALLVEHGEFTTMSGLNGLISYAKFVSYDTQ